QRQLSNRFSSTEEPNLNGESILQQFVDSFNNSSDLSVTEFPHLTVKIYYFGYLINKDYYEKFLSKL
ncbi:hypothetical protein, partial [Neobacillus niacini]